MSRLFALALLLTTSTVLAQTQSIPITGRVLNKDTGQPIAGATVRYRGDGNVSDANGQVAPPSLQGQVTTAADGTYSTPPLPAFGDFTLHASATGFFSALDYLQALPATARTPPPPMFDLKHHNPDAPTHDGTLRLRPDLVSLQPMSAAALAAFQMPPRLISNRTYLAASFSSDLQHLAFLTYDSIADPSAHLQPSVTRTCRLWSYDLQTGALTGADVPGSPYTADLQRSDPPPNFCAANRATMLSPGFYVSGYAIAWDGPILYLIQLKPDENSPATSPAITSYLLRDSTLAPVAPNDRPSSIQAVIAENSRVRKDSPDDANSQSTTDHRFTVKEDFSHSEGRQSCSRLVAVATNPHTSQTISQDCPGFTWLLDPAHDLIFYTQRNRTPYPGSIEDILVYNLKTSQQRTFNVPAMNNEPQLLTAAPQPDGSTRLAYTIRGDCDFAASDYSQPGQPDGVLGNTPNQSSVCFITIPPAPTQ